MIAVSYTITGILCMSKLRAKERERAVATVTAI